MLPLKTMPVFASMLPCVMLKQISTNPTLSLTVINRCRAVRMIASRKRKLCIIMMIFILYHVDTTATVLHINVHNYYDSYHI